MGSIFDALHRHGTASEAMKAGHVLVRPNQNYGSFGQFEQAIMHD
jgi:hypothetical protein